MVLKEDLPIHDREAFNAFVYFPLEDAVKELLERERDKQLEEYVEKSLPEGVPEAMKGEKSLVLCRHLATSNYEINRFAMVADSFPQFKSLILEYSDDTFNDVNEDKYYLGRLRFHKGVNKRGEPIVEHLNIIDFKSSNKKPISNLETVWGERLVDFHHHLFNTSFPQLQNNVFDFSAWLRRIAPTAKQYYKSFFTLFLKDGILFENFMPEGKEFTFTRDIILPAILEIEQETGYKPLLVALEPTDIEGDNFWRSHSPKTEEIVKERLARAVL
jgi:hypothetical protein